MITCHSKEAMHSEYFRISYHIIGLLAFLCGLWNFRTIDRSQHFITLLLGIAFFTECIAYYLDKRYHNNLSAYSISNLFQFLAVALYFNFSIKEFRRKGIGIMIGLGGVGLGIANIIFLQPLDQMDSYFMLFEGIMIISLCLFAFANLMLENRSNRTSLQLNPHFWICTTLTFFWSITFLSWGFYDYILFTDPGHIWIIHTLIISVNIVTYFGLGIALLRFPKALTT